MARKKIREYDAKRIMAENITGVNLQNASILINPRTNVETLREKHPWLQGQLVVKPDQLFGKRKKHNLVLINVKFPEVQGFIKEYRNKEVSIGTTKGKLTHFLIEPFVEHQEEYYLAIISEREGDTIHFSLEGGIDVEGNWNNVKTIQIPTLENLSVGVIENLTEGGKNLQMLHSFIQETYRIFKECHFSYLEINPFAIENNRIHLLDTVARLDSCAAFLNKWLGIEFPQDFGQSTSKEEKHIKDIDENSGASLKLTILNPKGKIWNLLGGGGASIIYLDMIANLGKGKEIANYGESSGNPSTEESYQYAKSILKLMTENGGKYLFIVGGIANFTDVKKTFKGFIIALEEYGQKLKEQGVTIFVRRGGPHYKEGLELIQEAAEKLRITIYVHGPETSMPEIIKIAEDKIQGEL